MADILERVRKLVALTSSPNENEARTSAKLACDLMRKHGVVLSMPFGSRQEASPPPAPKPPPRAPDPPPRSKPGPSHPFNEPWWASVGREAKDERDYGRRVDDYTKETFEQAVKDAFGGQYNYGVNSKTHGVDTEMRSGSEPRRDYTYREPPLRRQPVGEGPYETKVAHETFGAGWCLACGEPIEASQSYDVSTLPNFVPWRRHVDCRTREGKRSPPGSGPTATPNDAACQSCGQRFQPGQSVKARHVVNGAHSSMHAVHAHCPPLGRTVK